VLEHDAIGIVNRVPVSVDYHHEVEQTVENHNKDGPEPNPSMILDGPIPGHTKSFQQNGFAADRHQKIPAEVDNGNNTQCLSPDLKSGPGKGGDVFLPCITLVHQIQILASSSGKRPSHTDTDGSQVQHQKDAHPDEFPDRDRLGRPPADQKLGKWDGTQ